MIRYKKSRDTLYPASIHQGGLGSGQDPCSLEDRLQGVLVVVLVCCHQLRGQRGFQGLSGGSERGCRVWLETRHSPIVFP